MADFRFACPNCGQDIECDELWSGHEIPCPTCQKELTVPPKPSGPPHAAFAAAKPGQARLSIGSSHAERVATTRPVAPQAAALEQRLAQAKAGQKGNAMKWVTVGAVIIVLGVTGFLGYPYLRDWQAKRSEAAAQSSDAATQQVATAAAEAAPAAAPAAEKELPLLPAVWTLDVAQAVIPEGRANGTIAGTNFVVETARLDLVGNICLLRLLQGSTASPDLGFMIYLRPSAGESITGRTWTVSQEMRGRTVPQVVRLRKTNPRYAAQQKTFSSGYAMKLELGGITNGVISGRIFLAVPPESEQSVVAGVFKAEASLGDAAGATAVNPVAPPGTAPAPAAEPANFEQRYGIKR
jgi:type II secretory pathway pseudopilin PulG